MHPLFRDFCIATETLLGLPNMVCRLIVLRYTDHPDEQEKDFVDNTILAQPKQEKIMQTLPPSDADVSKYNSVFFDQNKVNRAQLASQKALTVDPAEYIRCVRLRQQVCPVCTESTARPVINPAPLFEARIFCISYSSFHCCVRSDLVSHVTGSCVQTAKTSTAGRRKRKCGSTTEDPRACSAVFSSWTSL